MLKKVFENSLSVENNAFQITSTYEIYYHAFKSTDV